MQIKTFKSINYEQCLGTHIIQPTILYKLILMIAPSSMEMKSYNLKSNMLTMEVKMIVMKWLTSIPMREKEKKLE